MSVKIFLSAVSDEFADYREELRRDLTRHNVEVKIQEDFKDAGSVTLDKLDLYISHCDAVIQLVGDMTGSDAKPASIAAILVKHPDLVEKLPPLREPLTKGESISYTQWEAWLAHYHGKTLLIAQADAKAPRAAKFAPTEATRAAQQLHLQRLSGIERYPGFTFASPENLAKQLAYTAIIDLLAHDEAARLRPAEPARREQEFPLASVVVVLALLLLTPLASDRLTAALGLTLGVTAWLIGGVGGAGLALAYLRYFGVLGFGTAPEGSTERRRYDSLRAGVAAGGMPVTLYARWLTRALDAVDRFFGDAGKADQTLFPHAFGLKTPAPLWTSSALDRCLLLGLLYPIATVLIIWGSAGHVGPAEAALSLRPDLPAWQRALMVSNAAFTAFFIWQYSRMTAVKSLIWLAIGTGIGDVIIASAWANEHPFWMRLFVVFAMSVATLAVAFGTAFALAFLFRLAGGNVRSAIFATVGGVFFAILGTVVATAIAQDSAVTSGYFIATLAAASATSGSGVVAVSVPVAIAITGVGLDPGLVSFCLLFAMPVIVVGFGALLNDLAETNRRQGIVLLLVMGGITLICLVSPYWLSSKEDWATAGPTLLFLSLLTIINAAFDWTSLGLTRALLRRGLELRGWWPFLLAIVDALLAGFIIALLALTMVVGVQTFDYLAVHGGGKAVLPLGPLFDGLAAHPEAPEYWWLYALLLSTMIPSLLNLVTGGTALTRAAPGMTTLLLRHMPAGRDVPAFDRAWVALVLTLQVAGGVVLGIAAQAVLAIALIRYAMPWIGLGLLDMARAVAAFNIPEKIAALFGL
jgi:hypothetical protein